MAEPAPTVDLPPAPALPPPGSGPSWRVLLASVLPLYALDQATKWLVVRDIDPHRPLAILGDVFSLVYWTNTGAAWGMFANRSTFFLLIAVMALAVLTVLYRQGVFASRWAAAGLCLLLPGILGNLTDRVARGSVVDFLLFDLHFPGAHPFPAFNVADSCITLAVACFLIGSWREGRRASRK
jgi:signal peptidase II